VDRAQHIEIGYVAGVHGLAGSLKLRLHWEGSEALRQVDQIWLEKSGSSQCYRLEHAQPHGKGQHLVRLSEVSDRAGAEALKGHSVWVEREGLGTLEEGEYYLNDLVGAEVSSPAGPLGVVERIGIYPTLDTLVIRTSEDRLVEQPIQDEWLEEVDLLEGRVVLRSLEGLL
jgi:16S rRNA processing protein RimM